jgi:O-antigen/teichoic acid export membrane protein
MILNKVNKYNYHAWINLILLISGKILAYISLIIFINKLDLNHFAIYSFFNNLLTIIITFSFLGITQLLVLNLNLDQEEKVKNNLIATSFIIITTLSIFVSTFLFFNYKFFISSINISLTILFLIIELSIINQFFFSILLALKKSLIHAFLENILKNLFWIIILIFINSITLKSLFLLILLLNIIIFVILVFFLKKFIINFFKNLQKINFLSLFNTNLLKLSMINILALIFARIDIVIIEKTLGILDVGIYNFIYQLSSASLLINRAITPIYFPLIMTLWKYNKIYNVDKIILFLRKLSLLFSFFIFIFFLIFFDYFSYIITNSIYLKYKVELLILSFGYFLINIFSYNQDLLILKKRENKIILNYIISIIIGMPLYYFLSIKFNIFGIVIAFVLSNILICILNEISYKKKDKV